MREELVRGKDGVARIKKVRATRISKERKAELVRDASGTLKPKGKAPEATVMATAEKFRKEVAADKKKKEPVLGNTGKLAGTRADLMDQARTRGIKYFRILNKAELQEILSEDKDHVRTASPERIKEIQDGANVRWKAGWGTTKRTNKIIDRIIPE
jgi:hypothetical protein